MSSILNSEVTPVLCTNVYLRVQLTLGNTDDCCCFFVCFFALFALYYTSPELYTFFLQERKGTKMWVFMRYRGSYMAAVICVIIFCMFLVYRTPVDEVSEGVCACKDCVRQQTHSFWFNELYDLSIQPLLTRKNYVLSEDIFKYWKVLICKMTLILFQKLVRCYVGSILRHHRCAPVTFFAHILTLAVYFLEKAIMIGIMM